MNKTHYVLLYIICIMLIFVGCGDNTVTSIDNGKQENLYEIRTDYFSMTVPQTWKNCYKYSHRILNEINDIDIHISMISKNEFGEARIFTIYLLSLDDKENIEIALEDWVKPIAILSKGEVKTHLIGYGLANEMSCTPEEEKKFLQMIEDVPQIVKTIKAESEYTIDLWNEGMLEEIFSIDYKTPYAPMSIDVLDSSFKGYVNQTGETFLEKTSQGALEQFYLKKLDTVKYLYGLGNKTLVGVKDNNICLITCLTSNITGYHSPQVRDVITKIEGSELFEIDPAVLEIKNSYNSRYFFYWKIENGYIGFITLNGQNPSEVYNYTAYTIVLFKDLSIIGLSS